MSSSSQQLPRANPGDIIGIVGNCDISSKVDISNDLKVIECHSLRELLFTSKYLNQLLLIKPDIMIIRIPTTSLSRLDKWAALCNKIYS